MLEESYTPEDRKKLYILSINYLKLFAGDINKSENYDAPLSNEYPAVLVPPAFLIQMSELLEEKTVTSSSIFRKVIKKVLPDPNEWANQKASEVITRYQNQISATYGIPIYSNFIILKT